MGFLILGLHFKYVLDISCPRNTLFYSESLFSVNFEIQIQFHRMQASWFNLVNK